MFRGGTSSLRVEITKVGKRTHQIVSEQRGFCVNFFEEPPVLIVSSIWRIGNLSYQSLSVCFSLTVESGYDMRCAVCTS